MTWNDNSDGSLEFESPPFRADRFYVYIAWGDDRMRPLYIGKGNRPFTRIGQHLALAKWAGEVRTFECHAFLSVEEALEAETCAIYELDPIYNVIRLQPRWVFEANILATIERQEAEQKMWRAERAKLLLAKRRKKAEKIKAEKVKLPPLRPAAPPKPLRHIRQRPDIFTPDQLAIIAKVQNRGRAA